MDKKRAMMIAEKHIYKKEIAHNKYMVMHGDSEWGVHPYGSDEVDDAVARHRKVLVYQLVSGRVPLSVRNNKEINI